VGKDIAGVSRSNSHERRPRVKTDFVETTADELRRKIASFEAAYGVPTERMFDAFKQDGEFVETDDLHAWSLLADTLEAIGEPLR
jgi:hypothetical protein